MDYYHFFYPYANLVQRQTRQGFVPRLICRLLNEVLCDVAELTGDFRADLSTKSLCRNRFTNAAVTASSAQVTLPCVLSSRSNAPHSVLDSLAILQYVPLACLVVLSGLSQ